MTRIGLTLNEAKTSIKEARTGELSTFWVIRSGRIATSRMVTGIWEPVRRRRACNASSRKWETCLRPETLETWEEVRDRLNQILRGWSAYFSYGISRHGVSSSRQLRL